jgi:hypothetical protein
MEWVASLFADGNIILVNLKWASLLALVNTLKVARIFTWTQNKKSQNKYISNFCFNTALTKII